jgi:hypothetical protein
MGKVITAIAAFIVVLLVSVSFGAQAMAQEVCKGIEFPFGKDRIGCCGWSIEVGGRRTHSSKPALATAGMVWQMSAAPGRLR